MNRAFTVHGSFQFGLEVSHETSDDDIWAEAYTYIRGVADGTDVEYRVEEINLAEIDD